MDMDRKDYRQFAQMKVEAEYRGFDLIVDSFTLFDRRRGMEVASGLLDLEQAVEAMRKLAPSAIGLLNPNR